MRSSSSLLALLATHALAIPSSFKEGLRPADRYVSIDMEAYELEANGTDYASLQRRTPGTWCDMSSSRFGNCVALGSAGVSVVSLAVQIAQTIKGASDKRSCRTYDDQDEKFHWRFYATGSCHATATGGTWEGTVRDYLHAADNEVCGTHCVEFTHGADRYSGYLIVGPRAQELNVSCGPQKMEEQCGEGGVNTPKALAAAKADAVED